MRTHLLFFVLFSVLSAGVHAAEPEHKISFAADAFAKSSGGNAPQPGRTADGKPDHYEKIYDATVKGRSPADYFAAINGGWDKNLSTLRPSLDPTRSYLVIHSQEPKDVFDLRSPDIFKRGLLSKGIKKMAQSTFGIGHVFLSWRCQLEGGKMAEGTVGQTGELSNQFKKMLDNGWGLTTFVTKFTDGHLQTPALLDFEFEGEEPLHTLAIEVDPEICANAMGFVKKFLEHPARPMENFGLQMDPVKFEGGGCGSFGVSVLDQSRIFGANRIIPNFWRHMAARTSLFGQGDLELPEDAEPASLRTENPERTKKVSPFRLFLLSNWDASRRDGGQKVKIMDPELLLLFLKTVYRSFHKDLAAADPRLFSELRRSQLYRPRISIENTIVEVSEAQQEAIVRQTGSRVIDGTFDPQANTTVRQTLSWVKTLRRQGYQARPVRVGATKRAAVGVILDKAGR
jgi:hypothetical protein